MRLKILLLFIAMLLCSTVHSQDYRYYYYNDYYNYNYNHNDDHNDDYSCSHKTKKNYINLSFANSTIDMNGIQPLKSNYGASFSIGRTFFLHHDPIWGFLSFGLDATWIDLTYTNYQVKHITHWGTGNYQYHQGEISIHAGPSVTINPVRKLNIHAYFRYAPSLSGLYREDSFSIGYGSFHIGGASISYGSIGLGFEARFGNCDYHEKRPDDTEETSSCQARHNGWRAYITFRF